MTERWSTVRDWRAPEGAERPVVVARSLVEAMTIMDDGME